MPKVLYVSSSGDALGGAERCLLDVAPRIAQAGWQPLVAVPFAGRLATELAAAGVAVRVADLGVLRSRQELRSPWLGLRLAATLPAAARLAALIQAERVAVVHSNSSVVLAGALAARLTGRAHVWHVRELLGGPSWRLLRPLILALSDRVVAISTAVADNLAALDSPARRRVRIIPDGIDLAHFTREAAASEAPAARVGMVARLTPWKGHDLFLRAAGQVARRFPEAEFYLVGGHLPVYEGLRQRLVGLRDRLGLESRAHFVDHLDRDALRDFLGSLQVFVLPSTAPEPGGLALLEAMALARAVVATGHGGPLDIVTPGRDGYLAPPGDPAALAEAIGALLQEPAARHKLGRAARRRIEAAYGLPLHIQRLGALYPSL